MQRNPSHFGSYCQPSPLGTSSTERASIGSKGGFKGNEIGTTLDDQIVNGTYTSITVQLQMRSACEVPVLLGAFPFASRRLQGCKGVQCGQPRSAVVIHRDSYRRGRRSLPEIAIG